MKPISAFVGHSFGADDAEVVNKFLKYFDALANMHPTFSWCHAEGAEPKVIDSKVLAILEGKNLLVGICTRKERAVSSSALEPLLFRRGRLAAAADKFEWKTSDWIIQEIGLAIGRGMDVVLLVERGVRSPGGLQGNLEYIEFDRAAPEKAFPKLLEMIAALAPKMPGHVEGAVGSATGALEVAEPAMKSSERNWMNPKPTWKRRNFEFAYMHFASIEDDKRATEIHDHFLASEIGGSDRDRKGWDAFKLYVRISFGKGGQLAELEKLARENPTNDQVLGELARSYLHYDEFVKASGAFVDAAAQAAYVSKEIALLADAACAAHQAGAAVLALDLLGRMRRRCESTGEAGKEFAEAERRLSELQKEDDVLLAAMERVIDLAPADNDTRFSLAYKYSDTGSDNLAALHYGRIPHADRSAIAWNNLGVALERLELPAKSVSAYRKAEELGETLAMSNIATKLIDSGFLPEAQTICDVAVGHKDHHKNVDRTLARLKDVSQEEETKESEILLKARPVHEFYRGLGNALAVSMPSDVVGEWQGPDCKLVAEFDGALLLLNGTYQRRGGGLLEIAMLGGEASTGKASSDATTYCVGYRAIVRGRAAFGHVKRVRQGEVLKSAAATLLTVGDESPAALLSLSADGRSIQVLERGKLGGPRLYSFTRI